MHLNPANQVVCVIQSLWLYEKYIKNMICISDHQWLQDFMFSPIVSTWYILQMDWFQNSLSNVQQLLIIW